MPKRITILSLLFLVFTTGTLLAGKGTISAVTLSKVKKYTADLRVYHTSSELNLVHCQNTTARTSTTVQKDSFFGTTPSSYRGNESYFTTGSLFTTLFPFSKSYIDHIYPSHHFW